MDTLRTVPVLGQLLNVLDSYPRISAWVVLSVGIVALLVYEARDVGLSAGNWAALIIASVVVAGLCIWIVSWEDTEDSTEAIRITSEMQAVAPTSTEEAAPAATDASPTDSDQPPTTTSQ